MNKKILFKTLVDILYILHFIGLLIIVIMIPLGIANVDQSDLAVKDWDLFYWGISVVGLITYLLFLRGLFFLRKMARFLLTYQYFSENIIKNLKQSGKHFLFTGVASFIIFLMVALSKLYYGKFELVYDINLLVPLFLTIIGIFFIIQSNALNMAKNIKEENELTV